MKFRFFIRYNKMFQVLLFRELISKAYSIIKYFENNIEFFISAIIYTNKDNLMNGKYQYNSIGMPFMANLGQLIHNYEKQRKQTYKPDLKEFKFDYSKEE